MIHYINFTPRPLRDQFGLAYAYSEANCKLRYKYWMPVLIAYCDASGTSMRSNVFICWHIGHLYLSIAVSYELATYKSKELFVEWIMWSYKNNDVANL